jgi:hypothetical protein
MAEAAPSPKAGGTYERLHLTPNLDKYVAD